MGISEQKKKSRAYEAGKHLGESVVEMINLMYQKNTSNNFIDGFEEVLKKFKDDRAGIIRS
jgi:hypothetical protein